jgi:hypothetical protein
MADISYIENHYGVTSHEILAQTRNVVCSANIEIIKRIIKAIDPCVDFKIYVLPTQEGSYQDIIKIVTANRITAVCAIGALLLAFLTFKSSLKFNDLDEANQQLEFMKHIKTMGLSYDDLPTDSMKKIYNDIFLQKEKAKRYKALLNDKDVKNDINIANDSEFNQIHKTEVKRNEFAEFIIEPESEKLEPTYKLHKVRIDSPIITLDSNAQWKTKDLHTKKPISFYLEDKNFKADFLSDKYPLKKTSGDDTMVVYIEYERKLKDEEEIITRRNAVEVYQINEHLIKEIPEGLEFNNKNLRKNPNQISIDDFMSGEVN